MKISDEQVLKYLMDEVPPALETKFRAGMAKYRSPIMNKDCLAEAVPEALDLLVYLAAASLQKRAVCMLVDQLRAKYWSMEDDEIWEELDELLRPRPRAVKTKE